MTAARLRYGGIAAVFRVDGSGALQWHEPTAPSLGHHQDEAAERTDNGTEPAGHEVRCLWFDHGIITIDRIRTNGNWNEVMSKYRIAPYPLIIAC